MRRHVINIFRPKNFPFWIVLLNYLSLAGIIFYPMTALANYARLGDYSFYQPTGFEYLLIYTYPPVLLLISWGSYTLFNRSRVIAAALPLIVITCYGAFLASGLFFKIVPQIFW
jgi:hypothetical protein